MMGNEFNLDASTVQLFDNSKNSDRCIGYSYLYDMSQRYWGFFCPYNTIQITITKDSKLNLMNFNFPS
jgi:hypothetical protein